MTIQQAIEKAIEGGYDGEVIYGSKAANTLARVARTKSLTSNIYLYNVLLDHLFWQSLGKAMNWGEETECPACGQDTDDGSEDQENWHVGLFQWHCFIDHLAEGKDAKSFFEKL